MSIFLKALLVIFASISGYLIVEQVTDNEGIALAGLVSGILIALAALKFEERVAKAPIRVDFGGAIGLITGLVVANLITYPLVLQYFNNPYLEFTAYITVNCIIGYLGLSIGMKKGDEYHSEFKLSLNGGKEASPYTNALVLDTSVIIDGRITDICETGFIDGTLVVPKFVLAELQYIADSPDTLKKTRGTRGLDILERLQKNTSVDVIIADEDFPSTKQVDQKLVEFAKKHGAKILTNDINLNKIAKLHGVTALNINSLANAMKPVILPGEEMNILVIKEGKEEGQGVGYLDDGTMVVIDNGLGCIGKTVTVSVTSILQTSNGRMIFSKVMDGKKQQNNVVRAVT